MTFVGLTALSVLIIINLETLFLIQALITLFVPNTLFLIASIGLVSINGTCLCAAAWNTTSGCFSLKISLIALYSRIEAINDTISIDGSNVSCVLLRLNSCSSIYNEFSLISIINNCLGLNLTI